MKKYPKGHFGHNYHLDTTNQEKLYALNESMKKNLPTIKELSFIKEVEFDIELENNPKLMCDVTLRSKEKLRVEFSSYIDESAIELTEDYAIAYFGAEKVEEVKSFFDDEGGSLNFNFLNAHEQDLCNQLKESYLLDCTPNTEYGGEFTDSDIKFFMNIKGEAVA